MLVTCQEMSEAEEKLFSGGISPEPYMDEAGRKCAAAIQHLTAVTGRVEIFCGKGNNGGDALVVGRWLKKWGWQVTLNFSHGREGISELARKKLVEFDAEKEHHSLPGSEPLILVDGLLGIGATGDLRGAIREEANRINSLRERAFGICFAIDIPTGLNANTGEPAAGAVKADYTLSICQAKVGFADDRAINHVGRLVEIPLNIPVESGDRSKRFLFPSNLRARLRRRDFDTHKGSAGRVTIVAGSRGMAGAASLAATGASNAGAGLVTVCVPEDIYEIVAAQCPLECMVKPIRSADDIASLRSDVVALGPGLGDHGREYLGIILSFPGPMVVDADGLNALAISGIDPAILPSNRLLTPHPGELARLCGENGDRTSLTRELADRWGVTLLHKGARTAIATPGELLELNTTGHPGMASGGMGDVLTGACAALAAQGFSLHDSGCVASWLLGRAAELASSRTNTSQESVTASLVASTLGSALRSLQNSPH